jgi:predicted RNA binding protein YcfA (HicA-like mRNA interferase family)
LGKLRVLTAREVVRILEANGYAAIRQTGSHLMMQGVAFGKSRTVPVPMHRRDMPEGTLRSIIKRSGLPRELFEE